MVALTSLGNNDSSTLLWDLLKTKLIVLSGLLNQIDSEYRVALVIHNPNRWSLSLLGERRHCSTNFKLLHMTCMLWHIWYDMIVFSLLHWEIILKRALKRSGTETEKRKCWCVNRLKCVSLHRRRAVGSLPVCLSCVCCIFHFTCVRQESTPELWTVWWCWLHLSQLFDIFSCKVYKAVL